MYMYVHMYVVQCIFMCTCAACIIVCTYKFVLRPLVHTYSLLQDFDLCVSCYKSVGHEHPMDKLGIGLEDETTPQDRSKDPKKQRKAAIEKCICYLVHATKCHDPHCKQPSCIQMKRVLTHTRECKLMLSNKWNMCKICKQFVLLCISHAKNCNEDKCPVPVCARIKKNLRDQRNQQSVQRQRFMQQRMALMSMNSQPTIPNTNSVASPATSTSPSNPTSHPSPSKGSPANHPSHTANNSPAAMTASPAGPQSGGKGGPRTPASEQMTGKAPRMTASVSPAVQGLPPAAPTGKMEQNMPVPNVTVSASMELPVLNLTTIEKILREQQRTAVGRAMMARAQQGTQLPHDSVASPATSTSPSNPTSHPSPSKGSPANHPSHTANNSPAAMTTSHTTRQGDTNTSNTIIAPQITTSKAALMEESQGIIV